MTAPPRFALPEAALQGYLAQHEALDFVIVGVVGSHSYGFPSRDSDFDLKAIHLAPIEALVGLEQPPATVQFLGEHEGLEIDFTSHEARDALRRLLAGDGNVLERILSPYQLRPRGASERLAELRQLALANLSRRFFRHYAGFFRGVLTRMHKEPQQRIKPLLYAFRVALSGVHLLREGELVADLALLLERYPFAGVAELIARKESAEQATIASPEPYLALLPELEALLERAHERSPLPAEPPCAAELDAWLRRWRWARPR